MEHHPEAAPDYTVSYSAAVILLSHGMTGRDSEVKSEEAEAVLGKRPAAGRKVTAGESTDTLVCLPALGRHRERSCPHTPAAACNGRMEAPKHWKTLPLRVCEDGLMLCDICDPAVWLRSLPKTKRYIED